MTTNRLFVSDPTIPQASGGSAICKRVDISSCNRRSGPISLCVRPGPRSRSYVGSLRPMQDFTKYS